MLQYSLLQRCSGAEHFAVNWSTKVGTMNMGLARLQWAHTPHIGVSSQTGAHEACKLHSRTCNRYISPIHKSDHFPSSNNSRHLALQHVRWFSWCYCTPKPTQALSVSQFHQLFALISHYQLHCSPNISLITNSYQPSQCRGAPCPPSALVNGTVCSFLPFRPFFGYPWWQSSRVVKL